MLCKTGHLMKNVYLYEMCYVPSITMTIVICDREGLFGPLTIFFVKTVDVIQSITE